VTTHPDADPGVQPDQQPGGAMELDPEEMSHVINRIKRAQGQLGGVVRMLEEGRDCEAVVTQLAAVSKALDRAGFAVVASGMQQCLANPTDDGGLDVKRMEKLFLTLA
jgi:DNA-binding FrmR family transcriptional regulator